MFRGSIIPTLPPSHTHQFLMCRPSPLSVSAKKKAEKPLKQKLYQKKHICDICKQVFDYYKTLVTHWGIKHPANKKEGKLCKTCGNFKAPGSHCNFLQEHLESDEDCPNNWTDEKLYTTLRKMYDEKKDLKYPKKYPKGLDLAEEEGSG